MFIRVTNCFLITVRLIFVPNGLFSFIDVAPPHLLQKMIHWRQRPRSDDKSKTSSYEAISKPNFVTRMFDDRITAE